MSTNTRRSMLKVFREVSPIGERARLLRRFSRLVRTSEYHLTNGCNLRCQNCWFFEFEFDQRSSEVHDIDAWRDFASKQNENGVTHALLIGGEPTLRIDRIAEFVKLFPYVTISTNGLIPLPVVGFERVAIAVTVFGGEGVDDGLRGIRPSGSRIHGLFDDALRNYKNDRRVTFVYALSADAIDKIDSTVAAIQENGNHVSFNLYSKYSSGGAWEQEVTSELLEEALRVKEMYPDVVLSHPYFIRTLITGRSGFGSFSYDVCPSISMLHPSNEKRMRNGNPVLPGFNSYRPDLETVNFCCTSGKCLGCRDSQAIYSWLIVNVRKFLASEQEFVTWMEIAESYWRHYVWSPFHRSGDQS